jgi:drug/metabolite transporter (DMT)-like permease
MPVSSNADRLKGILAMSVCALLWSTSGALIKLVDWNPLALAGARSLLGFITMAVALRRLPRIRLSAPLLLGALFYSATLILFVSANKLTTSANAILLQYSAPVWTALFGALLLREKVRRSDILFMALTLAAMTLFFLDKLAASGLAGNLLAIASGFTYGLSFVFFGMGEGNSSDDSLMLSHLLTFLICLPFLATSGAPRGQFAWLGVLLLGVFQIGLASVFMAYGIKRVSPLDSILTAFLEPCLNPVWVLLFLGEKPSPWALVGGSAIVILVGLRSFLQTRPARVGKAQKA